MSLDLPIDPTADNCKFSPFLKIFRDLNLFSKETPISSMSDCFISNPKPNPYFFLGFRKMLAESSFSDLLKYSYPIDGNENKSKLFKFWIVLDLNESLKTSLILNSI